MSKRHISKRPKDIYFYKTTYDIFKTFYEPIYVFEASYIF